MKQSNEMKSRLVKTDLPSECTTILVGQKMSADNSMMVARSEDWDAMFAKNMTIYEDTDNGPTQFVAIDSPFRCELPKKRFGYTALEPFHLPGHWGSAGFNSQGVGMSATESIFSSEKALKADPLQEDGIAENSVFNIVLPYVKTAREGVERLGMMIEKYGTAEGFGVGFVDKDEIWYFETACGHRWLACRIPDDVYFVTGNQSRFREYNPKDTKNFLASKDLIPFAREHKLFEGDDSKFDFHEAYIRDEELDTTYNYPRVCGIQAILNPEIKNDIKKNDFPVYAKANNKINLTQMRKMFRFHYNDTDHDPYLNSNPKEIYRPVSIFRTTQTHILHVRPELPKEIGQVNYVCMGMAALSVFIPFYQTTKQYLEPYSIGTNVSDDKSAYWKFRKVQTLGMTNFNKYAPMIQDTYVKLEEELDQRQMEMEADYMKIYKEQPLKAEDLLQEFARFAMQRALDVTDELIERLFTQMAIDIQDEYRFAGA